MAKCQFHFFDCRHVDHAVQGVALMSQDVQIVSDTSDTETNETVFAIKDAPVPAGSTLEVMGGNKVVLQTTDVLKIDCDVADKIDATLSIMEIT